MFCVQLYVDAVSLVRNVLSILPWEDLKSTVLSTSGSVVDFVVESVTRLSQYRKGYGSEGDCGDTLDIATDVVTNLETVMLHFEELSVIFQR